MKFGATMMATAIVGYSGVQAEGIGAILDVFSSDVWSNPDFYQDLLLTLQRDTGNTQSSCATSFATIRDQFGTV